jgi:hypothetical protein
MKSAAFFSIDTRETLMKSCIALFIAAIALSTAGASVAAPLNIAIDADTTRTSGSATGGTITTQPDFVSWDLTNVLAQGTTIVEQGVTFELFGLGAANKSRVRAAGSGDSFNALTTDFVYNEGSANAAVGLRMTGLPVGVYAMQSWHFDTDPNVVGTENFMKVEVRNMGGTAATLVSKSPFSPTPIAFQFDVTDAGQIKEIIFREDDAATATDAVDQNRARLNGFTLTAVPEPSAAGLLMFGIALARRAGRAPRRSDRTAPLRRQRPQS